MSAKTNERGEEWKGEREIIIIKAERRVQGKKEETDTLEGQTGVEQYRQKARGV